MSQSRLEASAAAPVAAPLFISGQTRAGRMFRPSDWVDRVAGLFADFGQDRKLRYSPLVHPATLAGQRGLWLDTGLRQRDPQGYAFVMDFIATHDLAVQPVENTGA